MGLEWCKLIDTEFGWVSDNYLSFARVIKWYYNPVTSLQPDKPFQESCTVIESCNLPTCREWLKAYGYSNDGKVADIRPNILQLKSNSEDPPKLLDNKGCRVTDINQCVGSLLLMVSCVMVRSVHINTTPYEMEWEAKLVINIVHNVDIIMNKGNDKDYIPDWLSKYNFQSLLNLPKAMELYGPLINLRKARNKREGYFRFAKPITTDIRSNNWQIRAHLKFFSERFLDLVVNYHRMNN